MQDLGLIHKQSPIARAHTHFCHSLSFFENGDEGWMLLDCARATERAANTLYLSMCVCL